MFIKNRLGADLIPGLLTALALSALGLAFISRFAGGTKAAGNTINNSANSLGSKLNNEINSIP